MLRLKSGVSIAKLTPRMVAALIIVEDVYDALGYPCVVTSGDDSVGVPGGHKPPPEGKHGLGDALDFRTKHMPATVALDARNAIAERLGSDFDVLLESDHLHLEFDPKP